jgi:hypothetical protein
MKLGALSDTHDNMQAITRAVEIFNEEKVDLVLHGGDHIAPFTVNWMSNLNMKVIGVKGNLDAEFNLLSQKYSENNWEFYRHSAVIEAEGKKIILLHGVDENVVNAIIKSGNYDIVIRGHLHRVINEKVGETLHFSPGEACGYLTGKSTIGILRLPEISVEIIEI